MLEGQSLRQSTVSKNEKQKSMCLPDNEFHLQCNLHFYKYSMSKATRDWKTRAASSSKSQGKTRVRFPPSAQTWRPQGWAQEMVSHRPHPTLCWQLGSRARAYLFLSPRTAYCQVCSPPLTKGKKSRQELAWEDSVLPLSFKYVWGVGVQVCVHVCVHSHGHVWRGRPDLEALSFAGCWK